MIPLRVSLQDFMSYRDEQTLLFDGASLWVLAGANGTGKSAIFDAVTFALYGRHRGGSQNAPDLINHHADALAVEFDFLRDGVAYRVRRTVRQRGQPTREAFRLITSNGDSPAHVEPIPDTDTEQGFRRWVTRTIGLEYETFTSSVLLLQGQSEKLLQAIPRDRYNILAELIDLSPYQRLYKVADNRRREHNARVKSLSHQLGGVPTVSNADLKAAQDATHRAEEEWQQAQVEVARLTGLVAQAKEWERLIRNLEDRQAELEKVRKLLNRTEEILEGFGRWQELQQVLPTLRSIVEQRERLAGCVQRIKELQQRIQQEQGKLADLEGEEEDLKDQVEQLECKIRELESDDLSLAKRLAELAPIVTRLEELEKAQDEIDRLEKALTKLPPDLARVVEQAEEKDEQLTEIKQALPWLEQLVQTRAGLNEASKREREAHDKLEALGIRLRKYRDKREQIGLQLGVIRAEEDKLAHTVTRAQTKYEEACQRRERFEKASTQPTCELCGQPITPEHARQERARLDTQAATAKANLDNLKAQCEESENHRKGLEADLADLDGHIAGLDEMRGQNQNERSQAKQDTRHYTDQIKCAFNNLSSAYQMRVAPEAPSNQAGWLVTTYPTEAELKALEENARSREAHTKRLHMLREQSRQWQRLDGQRQAANERLAELTAACPLSEAQQARREQDDLGRQQEGLYMLLEQWREAFEKTKVAADQAHQVVGTRRARLQNHSTDLASAQATQSEIERSLEPAIESLLENWQKQASVIELDELEEWEAEYERLTEYANLAIGLEQARHSEAGLNRRVKELEDQINELPYEAQSPLGEIEKELKTAKNESSSADTKRREAESGFIRLEQQREQRRSLEEMHRDADRQHHLYKLLTNLLGRDGLQLHLLRRAEQAIVDLANEVLDGLSRGRMRLELRGANGQADAQSNKALDLVVYNYDTEPHDTEPHPTAVALASGSQRFRIAVSLALAIGQYAGQESRRIESVIIDEGFGSLDKDGRDDMIQELNELKQQLARIILVSHQEEFAGAFVNGYTVELKDGASRVSLLEQS